LIGVLNTAETRVVVRFMRFMRMSDQCGGSVHAGAEGAVERQVDAEVVGDGLAAG
jgi:hypothetical protein